MDSQLETGLESIREVELLVTAIKELDKHISDGGVLPDQWLQREWQWADFPTCEVFYIRHLRGAAIVRGKCGDTEVSWQVGWPCEDDDTKLEKIFCEGTCQRQFGADAHTVAQERCYFILDLFNQYTDEE